MRLRVTGAAHVVLVVRGSMRGKGGMGSIWGMEGIGGMEGMGGMRGMMRLMGIRGMMGIRGTHGKPQPPLQVKENLTIRKMQMSKNNMGCEILTDCKNINSRRVISLTRARKNTA
jgi:hypothetical protein